MDAGRTMKAANKRSRVCRGATRQGISRSPAFPAKSGAPMVARRFLGGFRRISVPRSTIFIKNHGQWRHAGKTSILGSRTLPLDELNDSQNCPPARRVEKARAFESNVARIRREQKVAVRSFPLATKPRLRRRGSRGHRGEGQRGRRDAGTVAVSRNSHRRCRAPFQQHDMQHHLKSSIEPVECAANVPGTCAAVDNVNETVSDIDGDGWQHAARTRFFPL